MWKEPGYQDGLTKSVTVFDLQFCWEENMLSSFWGGPMVDAERHQDNFAPSNA